jgi:membrane protein implicated in regulation of membrane protease activity
MTGVYLFFALVGGVLAAVITFGSGDADADVDLDADLDLDTSDVGAGEVGATAGSALASIFSFRTLVFASAFFGITGLIVPLVGAGTVTTLVLALGVGGLAGFVNDRLLRFLKRTSGDARITEDHLVGARARVAVPVGAGRRGRVMVDIDGRTVGMVAEAYRDLRESFAQDDQVVVVEVKDGVARIAPMDDIE